MIKLMHETNSGLENLTKRNLDKKTWNINIGYKCGFV